MGRLLFACLAVASACSFEHGRLNPGGSDAGGDDGMMPDTVPPDGSDCTGPSIECADNDTLRTCSGAGVAYHDDPCAWGCTGPSGSAHCANLVPHAGAVTKADTMNLSALSEPTLTDVTINGDTGEIGTASNASSVRAAGTGPGIVSDDAITSTAVINASGPCTNLGRTTGGGEAGPGGFRGGEQYMAGSGQGGGGPGTSGNPDEGGGGGGHGGTGGLGGGNSGSAGVAYEATIANLIGGSGGGGAGGGGANSQSGGGGGGAVQLISNKTIGITSGGINAGGCGGFSTTGPDGGAGGGAGGTIVLEAPSITIAGTLAVNGGGGGAGSTATQAQGENGKLSRAAALGATGSSTGGDGAAGGTLNGGPGEVSGGKASGGGGGIGRMRLNTKRDAFLTTTNATLSPNFSDTNTTATHGSAATN